MEEGADAISLTTGQEEGNVTVSIPIPDGQEGGEHVLTAAIPYLVGVSLLGFHGRSALTRAGLWINRDTVLQSESHNHRLVVDLCGRII